MDYTAKQYAAANVPGINPGGMGLRGGLGGGGPISPFPDKPDGIIYGLHASEEGFAQLYNLLEQLTSRLQPVLLPSARPSTAGQPGQTKPTGPLTSNVADRLATLRAGLNLASELVTDLMQRIDF